MSETTPNTEPLPRPPDDQVIKYIEDNLDLKDILSEVDMTPDKLTPGSNGWNYMLMVVCAYKLGKEHDERIRKN